MSDDVPDSVVSRAPVAIITLSVLAMLFEGYDINVYGAVLPYLLKRSDWAMGPGYGGLIGSASVLGMLVGALVTGLLIDLIGRRRVYLAAVGVFSVGSGLCAVAPSPELLLVGRVVVGLGLGGFIPVALAMVAEYTPSARRAFATTMVAACIGAGGALSALVAIWIGPVWGYRGPFWIGVAPLVLVLPLAVTRIPESISLLLARGQVADARAQVRRYRLPVELLETSAPARLEEPARVNRLRTASMLFGKDHRRASVVFWLADALSLLLLFGAITWLPVLLTRLGYSISSALLLLLIFQLSALAASVVGSWLADRLGMKVVVLASYGCALVGLLSMIGKPPLAVIYLLVALVGVGAVGGQNLLLGYLTTYYPPVLRGSGVGLAVAFGRLGGIIGPVVGGFLLGGHLGPAWSFAVFASATLLTMVVLAFGPGGASAEAPPEVSSAR